MKYNRESVRVYGVTNALTHSPVIETGVSKRPVYRYSVVLYCLYYTTRSEYTLLIIYISSYLVL